MSKMTTKRKQQLTEAVILVLFDITAESPSVSLYKNVLINAMIKNAQIERQKKILNKPNPLMEQVDQSKGSAGEDLFTLDDEMEAIELDPTLEKLSDASFEESALSQSLIVPRTEEDIPKKFNKGKLGKALSRAFDIVTTTAKENGFT